MGRGWDFRDKGDVIALKRVASRERNNPNKSEITEFPQRLQNTLRATVVVPKETITAATIDGSSKFILGKGQAYIYDRDQDSPDKLVQHLHDDGTPVEETIYNLCDTPFVPTGSADEDPDLGDALFVTQDLDGDYYITFRCDFDGSSGGGGGGSGGGGGTIQDPFASNLRIRATDEGLVAGNTRGNHSTDLQTERNNPSQVASGTKSVITGGASNEANNYFSGVFGGLQNKASGSYGGVFNGRGHYNTGSYGLILNGAYNTASNNMATVVNGRYSTASGYMAFIGNGRGHSASGSYSLIVNGRYHTAYSNYSTILNGQNNRSYANYGTILNGFQNRIYSFATNSFIACGRYNRITASYGTILSGAGSYVYASHGVAIGKYATVGGYHSMQFGSGFNSEAYTVNIGSAGLRFKMTSGAPFSLQNGDIWISGGTVYIRSAGVSVAI